MFKALNSGLKRKLCSLQLIHMYQFLLKSDLGPDLRKFKRVLKYMVHLALSYFMTIYLYTLYNSMKWTASVKHTKVE